MKLLRTLNITSPLMKTERLCTNKKEFCADNSSIKNTTCSALDCLSVYNKANINFTGYFGDKNPSKKLFWIVSGRNEIYRDEETEKNAWRVNGKKRWSTMLPADLLKRTPEQAIQSICTLNDTYYLPDYIGTPNYGDNWGRRANYIEFNPRLLAKTEGAKKSEGILNMIKILPAIPPSGNSIPNCIILSQLYPTYACNNDGYLGDNSLYTTELCEGISKNLTSEALFRNNSKMGDDELVRAFNDLAHFRGIKTGFRMPLSENQITVNKRPFNWDFDCENYINSCALAIDLGFDCIFFDSAKHVGNWDMENYFGSGRLPNYQQMQYITSEIRKRTGRDDIAFIAEKADLDGRFENLGFSAGNDWGQAWNKENLLHEYEKQTWNSNYAAGPIISDDNDNGCLSYEERLNKIRNAFSSFYEANKKLPVYMQMHDLFPLAWGINTHEEMLKSTNRSAWGDINSNYNNTFATTPEAYNHINSVYQEFANISCV